MGSRKRGRLPDATAPLPSRVIAPARGRPAAQGTQGGKDELKALWHQQGGDEIAAEGERDDKAENGIEHGSSSQPVESVRIEDESVQNPYAQRHISKIKHGKLLPGWAWKGCATKTRQGSIPNVGAGYKGNVRMGVGALRPRTGIACG